MVPLRPVLLGDLPNISTSTHESDPQMTAQMAMDNNIHELVTLGAPGSRVYRLANAIGQQGYG